MGRGDAQPNRPNSSPKRLSTSIKHEWCGSNRPWSPNHLRLMFTFHWAKNSRLGVYFSDAIPKQLHTQTLILARDWRVGCFVGSLRIIFDDGTKVNLYKCNCTWTLRIPIIIRWRNKTKNRKDYRVAIEKSNWKKTSRPFNWSPTRAEDEKGEKRGMN